MLNVIIETQGLMIWLFVNSNKCVVKPGLKNIPIYVLIWLEIKMKLTDVISMKAKTHILNAFRKLNFLNKIDIVSN